MENNNKNRLFVQDFLISVISEDSAAVLSLEALEISSGRIFRISLDNDDTIAQITNGLFHNAEEMTHGLKDAVDNNCPELKLTITSEGKLTYTAILTAGRIRKEDGFSLNLAEPNEAAKINQAHESRMTSLQQTFQAFQEKSEERLNKLENMMLQMQQNLNQRVDALEKLYVSRKKESKAASFNASSVNASYFDFWDCDRTITLLSDSNPCLEVLPQIPQMGKHSYTFKINSEKQSLLFGITTQRSKQNWILDNCHYGYWTWNGYISGRVSKSSGNISPYGGAGQTLKMVVDMDKGILTFSLNDHEINSCTISTSDIYFVYVSLGAVGDSVTFLGYETIHDDGKEQGMEEVD